MTLSIDIDNFQNWSQIFREIQRQKNLAFFAAIEPPSFEENEKRKKKSCGRLAKETSRTVHLKLKRQVSDGEVTYGKKREAKYQPRRKSLQETPHMIETERAVIETRLTQAAQKLTSQEMALLYEDIFKPLDVFFYSLCQKKTKRRKYFAFCYNNHTLAINCPLLKCYVTDLHYQETYFKIRFYIIASRLPSDNFVFVNSPTNK